MALDYARHATIGIFIFTSLISGLAEGFTMLSINFTVLIKDTLYIGSRNDSPTKEMRILTRSGIEDHEDHDFMFENRRQDAQVIRSQSEYSLSLYVIT